MNEKRFAYPDPGQWERKTRGVYQQIPKLTLAELIEWAAENNIPADARLSATCHFLWDRPETDAEYAERIARQEDGERRHIEFIERRYAEIHQDDQ